MQALIWLVALVALAAIVASLASGLFHLSRGRPEDSAKLARALTVRIAISLALFALLMLAWHFGLIAPHALNGGAPRP